MQLKWPMLWDLFSLFPAYAGVILSLGFLQFKLSTFPRIRGGDPNFVRVKSTADNFSPHTRG